MRACCGAPALRGSPPRPGSLGWRGFSWFVLRPAGSISLITSTVSPTHCTESPTESRFSGSTARDDVALAERERPFCLVGVSVAGRGGDRRPERGGSSDAGRTLVPRGRGTAGGRTPAAARQVGGKGHCLRNHADRQGWLPQRGVGGRRGQGAAQAPVPCPPPGGDQARMPGNIRQPAYDQKKPIHQRRTESSTIQCRKEAKRGLNLALLRHTQRLFDLSKGKPLLLLRIKGDVAFTAKNKNNAPAPAGRRPSPYAGQHPPARARRKAERPLPHHATKNCSPRPGRPQTVASKYER